MLSSISLSVGVLSPLKPQITDKSTKRPIIVGVILDCYFFGSSKNSVPICQIPQCALVGAWEMSMYIGQLEFYNGEAPDRMNSL